MGFWDKLLKKLNIKVLAKNENLEIQNQLHPIVESYILVLKDAYYENSREAEWKHFEKVIHGARIKDISRIKKIYPEVSDAFINLLKYVDGTYWRKYEDDKITFYFFGSDIGNIHITCYPLNKY